MKLALYSVAMLAFLNFSCTDKSTLEKSTTELTDKKSMIKTEDLSYGINGVTHRSFAAYKTDSEGPLPVVFVLPEWWGLNDYVKNRAKQLAELGYYAVAVDYYGDGKVVETPEEAQKLSSHFYKIPIDARRMFDAAKNKVIIAENADHTRMAIVGYCFGGAQALNMGRTYNDFKGVVSFHGNLTTGIRAKNNKVKYLVLNGAADTLVPQEEIANYKKEMDSAKIDYKFVNYPDALHAFTNPEATATGKKFNIPVAYNKAADEKSWNEMKAFLAGVLK
ncbi:dienelactone hydrolase family protein [Chryseobacterium sp. cx-311]|uniref:dienelactone hydrolase family protein n=1 Tax=Marnyiella aurantia TaxID=2758037 RepID=UPI001AE77EB5|nr:dienelactone hydrolase family protein [Marnyiella aurantia]MBP0612898.1 dienelactone hydrolase family protein [Marnyiella aurantia]